MARLFAVDGPSLKANPGPDTERHRHANAQDATWSYPGEVGARGREGMPQIMSGGAAMQANGEIKENENAHFEDQERSHGIDRPLHIVIGEPENQQRSYQGV